MENISIHVKRFGRVKDSKLELSPFIIFTGESGLGKSYMALLCHYFYEVLMSSSRLNTFFKERKHDYHVLSKNFHNEGIALEIKRKDLEEWIAKDAISYVGLMIGDSSIVGEIKVNLPSVVPSVLIFRFKEELTGLVNEEDVDIILSLDELSYRVAEATLEEESPFSFLLRHQLTNYIFGSFRNLSHTFVFPPSRGPVLTELLTPQTGIYSQFLQDLNEINLMKNRDDYAKTSGNILNLFRQILDGEVKKVDSKYVYKTKEIEIPISAAAASIREIAPLEMLVKKAKIETSSVLFEEPEAHLHPLKQRMMADILSAFANLGTFMQITTHSDYLINRLNELILLNEIKAKKRKRAFLSFCKEINVLPELALDKTKISTYLMERRKDGFSQLKKQDLALDMGIPYRSFSEAIDNGLEIRAKLEEAISDDR